MAETKVIQSDLKAARRLEEQVLVEVARNGYDEAATFAIKLALEEGLNNAIRHGNAGDPSKTVRLETDIDPRRAVIVITDEGGGFDPQTVPDPCADENLEKPSGRGIMLMQAYMDEVHYNQAGNQLRIVKRNAREQRP